MKARLTLTLIAATLFTAVHAATWKKSTNGITVELKQSNSNDTRMVRLQVMGDKLIRVSATPERQFAKDQSLIIVPQPSKPTYTVSEHDGYVSVITKEVEARVSTTTGIVSFLDSNGQRILCEDTTESRTFLPITTDGSHGWTVTQAFESPADEAFFGLGQHQSDEFNYKGKNEELFQYNTKVSVPFIVSNKGYGLLWDAYSMLRFGDPREYMQLHRAFKLYDRDGKTGGLTGIYVPRAFISGGSTTQGKDAFGRVVEGVRHTAEPLVRQEDSLYFENLATIKHLPQGFPLNGADVTYEGYIEPQQTGLHRFLLYYAGYVKVFLDGKEVVAERWRTAWNPNAYKFAVNMKKGTRSHLRIEWKPDGGESYCGLRVLTPVSDLVQGKQRWWGEMQKMEDYYFIKGDDIDDVIAGYRSLTGKAQVMPKWAMGYWQSREKYNTTDEMLTTLKGFRDRRIPIDNIVLDWSHWPEDAWGSHQFDLQRFPDPRLLVDSIHAMHGRFMISCWPKFYTTTDHFKQFERKGWIYMQSVRDSLRDWVGKGYTYGFYDAYSAGARKLFWKQMQDTYYPLGIDAWWMDASEPNIRDCTDFPYRKALQGPTALGSATEYFNAYALMNAEAIYNGQRGVDNNKRVFLLTRSGFAGLQRYSTATWSGDIATRWEDMKAQISAGLNFSIAGVPWWTMDIGGFCVEKRYVTAMKDYQKKGIVTEDLNEWRELNTRWHQFGAFCPLYRSHGQWPRREPWEIAPADHPAYKSITYYINLRYRLMPYIYSMAGMVHFDDYTIMRPLVMDFTSDATACNIGDQFMFGPAFMAAPVYTYGARHREVYFPKGADWYDAYTGEVIRGGQTKTVDAPYERMPLYVRSGAIVPTTAVMQYTDERPTDEITLYVYAGNDARLTLYEDEGTNYNYEKGQYTTIELQWDDTQRTLTIGQRHGSYNGMVQQRRWHIVVMSATNSGGMDNATPQKSVLYDGAEMQVRLD